MGRKLAATLTLSGLALAYLLTRQAPRKAEIPVSLDANDTQKRSRAEPLVAGIPGSAPSSSPRLAEGSPESGDAHTAKREEFDIQITLSSDRREELAEAAWLTLGDRGPKLPGFDEYVFAESTKRGLQAWNSWKPFRSGVYFFYLDYLSGRTPPAIGAARLKYHDDQGVSVRWIKTAGAPSEGDVAFHDYKAWSSPFFEEERFFGAIHLPWDSFWSSRVKSLSCAEAVIIYTMLGSHDSKDVVDDFQARAYCRQARDKLIPVGQMAFQFSTD